MITFVRETQGLDFVGAIEWLAERFRIPLEYEEASPARRRAPAPARAALRRCSTQAAAFYERYLWDSQAGSLARDYLAGPRPRRGDLPRVPARARARRQHARRARRREKGFTRRGAARRRADAPARRRLLPAPARSSRSPTRAAACVGFQARRLHEDDPLQAKYVNTPESELFHKGSVLYGLDKARAAIAREDRACVVEGNTDVIALRQAGFEPVVACMGTALTEQQLRELGAADARASGSRSTATPPASRRRCAGWSSRSRRAST